jgi:hypothetical protein
MKTSKTLSPKQKKIAQVAGDPNKIEGEDFKKLKPMKANVGKFLLSKALDPKAGKSSKSFFESIGKFPFVERRMKLSGSTGSKAKMLGAGAVGAGAIAGTNEAIKDYSELSQSEEFKKGREKGAEKSKKFKERAKEVIGETVGKITGKRIGGSAIKGKGAVARDRGMGLQDENISVGKGADYIKDLIS